MLYLPSLFHCMEVDGWTWSVCAHVLFACTLLPSSSCISSSDPIMLAFRSNEIPHRTALLNSLSPPSRLLIGKHRSVADGFSSPIDPSMFAGRIRIKCVLFVRPSSDSGFQVKFTARLGQSLLLNREGASSCDSPLCA